MFNFDDNVDCTKQVAEMGQQMGPEEVESGGEGQGESWAVRAHQPQLKEEEAVEEIAGQGGARSGVSATLAAEAT